MTVSALVNSALVPEYSPGRFPGFPFSTQTAVELSAGSYGHFAMPMPTPGTYWFLPRCVKFDCNKNKLNRKFILELRII